MTWTAGTWKPTQKLVARTPRMEHVTGDVGTGQVLAEYE